MIKPSVTLDDGKLKTLNYQNPTDFVEEYHSGRSLIESGETLIIRDNRQSINFTTLTLQGILTLDGDLWLA